MKPYESWDTIGDLLAPHKEDWGVWIEDIGDGNWALHCKEEVAERVLAILREHGVDIMAIRRVPKEPA